MIIVSQIALIDSMCICHGIDQLPPSDAVRKKKKENILEDLFSSVLSQLKKIYHPAGNLKFNYLGISKA